MTVDRESLNELRAALGKSLIEIASDVHRAQIITSEAVSKIFVSFEGLRGQLNEQAAAFHEASAALDGSATGDGGFFGTIDTLVQAFVDELVRTSQDTIRLLDRLDVFGADLTIIKSQTDEVEGVAALTRLISLNARIEAHRAGAAGVVFRVVADEVKSLAAQSNTLATSIRRTTDHLQAEFNSARKLLEGMAAHDMSVALAATESLAVVMTKLQSVNSSLADSLNQISQDVSRAIEALQFEDMLLQLLVSIEGRLKSLVELCGEPWEGESFAAVVSKIEVISNKHSPAPVQQESMAVGELELF